MDSEHSCHGHPSVRGCFCFQLGAGAADDVGGLSRDTLVIRAETRAFGALTHPALPGGGHSRSWHRRQVIKVPSDSSDEAAGDKRPWQQESSPWIARAAREQLQRAMLHTQHLYSWRN